VKADVSVTADIRRMISESRANLARSISREQCWHRAAAQVRGNLRSRLDEILSVNLKSVFLVTQSVVGSMRKRNWGA